MANKTKIVFFIPSFHTGGSERVMLHLLNNLDRQKFEITLIGLKGEGILLQFLPKDIEIILYNYSRTLAAVFTIYKEIKKRKNGIVFSTLNQLNLLISILIFLLPKHIFICRESSIVSKEINNSRNPKIFKFLYKTTFHRFHSVICQSNEMANDLLAFSSITASKIKVINNPVDFRLVSPAGRFSSRDSEIKIVTVGQLRREKGHERIIRMLSKCSIPFHYKIIGDGPQRKKLEQLTKAYDMTDKVEFIGSIPSPYDLLASADIFIQGSYYEGFPNAVIEANASGVPALIIASPGGHHEIIVNGVNGWIDREEKLLEIIESKRFSLLDRNQIVSMTKDRYDLSKIASEYESHFLNIYHEQNALE